MEAITGFSPARLYFSTPRSSLTCFPPLGLCPPFPQVYMRVKAPLLTLMGGGNPEVEYCILKHLGAMIHRCPGVFDDEYRQVRSLSKASGIEAREYEWPRKTSSVQGHG